MFQNGQEVLDYLKEEDVVFVDIRFTDQELDTLEEAYRPQQVQHDRNEQLQSGQTAAADLKRLFRKSAGAR